MLSKILLMWYNLDNGVLNDSEKIQLDSCK